MNLRTNWPLNIFFLEFINKYKEINLVWSEVSYFDPNRLRTHFECHFQNTHKLFALHNSHICRSQALEDFHSDSYMNLLR